MTCWLSMYLQEHQISIVMKMALTRRLVTWSLERRKLRYGGPQCCRQCYKLRSLSVHEDIDETKVDYKYSIHHHSHFSCELVETRWQSNLRIFWNFQQKFGRWLEVIWWATSKWSVSSQSRFLLIQHYPVVLRTVFMLCYLLAPNDEGSSCKALAIICLLTICLLWFHKAKSVIVAPLLNTSFWSDFLKKV